MTKRYIEGQLEDLKAAIDSDTDGSAPAAGTVEWREAAPEARPSGMTYDPSSGTLTYDLWDAQRRCLDALEDGTTDIVAFLGGYASGKSVIGARWLIAQALAHPGSRFLVMGQDFAKADKTTFHVLFEQLPGDRTAVQTADAGPEVSPIVSAYHRSDHKLTLTNDTEIVLGSADSWKRLAGAEFGGIWLDEPSHYETDLHDLLEMLDGRFRGVAGPMVQCWTLTGNGYNDAWEILEQQRDQSGDPLGHNIELVRASTLDNPYHDDEAIERFKRKYAETARAEQALYGDFAAAQGLVYSDFRRERHTIPHDEAVERVDGEWRIYGYDAGWAAPRVLLEIGRTDYGQLVVLDAFHETKSYVENAIEWLQQNKKPRGRIYAEHEGADIDKFRGANYAAYKAKKALNPGIADVRKRLEADAEDRVGLLVSRQCEHLIREFLGYKTEHVGTTQAEDHCLDALRYAIHTSGRRGGCSSWGQTPQSTRSSGSGATVITSGTARARRRDRGRSRARSESRLQRPRTIDEVRRRQSR